MSIHSMHGCSCWHALRHGSKEERAWARQSIDRCGHADGCNSYFRTSLSTDRFNGKEPSDWSCYHCAGQGKCIMGVERGKLSLCPECRGRGQQDPGIYSSRLDRPNRKLRHDQVHAWRKWRMWRIYDGFSDQWEQRRKEYEESGEVEDARAMLDLECDLAPALTELRDSLLQEREIRDLRRIGEYTAADSIGWREFGRLPLRPDQSYDSTVLASSSGFGPGDQVTIGNETRTISSIDPDSGTITLREDDAP